jgi:hypothetical protein
MPATSVKQQHWAGACYGFAKAHGGKRKKGCPSMKVAREFAHKPSGGYGGKKNG